MISVLNRTRTAIRRDERGAIAIEFAYALPFLMLLSVTAIDAANFVIVNTRVSQITMTVADNLSRAKQSVPLGLPQLREVDINDNLLGASVQGGDSLRILEGGRIIVSSLQRNSNNRQFIAWQRCKGTLQVNSAYGAQGATQPNSGTSGFQGMGTGSTRVQAEANSAVIFAEVTYDYRPLLPNGIFAGRRIRREAAFYVRDDRDLTGGTNGQVGVYNPNPAAIRSSCNVYNTF